MSKNSEQVKSWRKRTKERLVQAFGGKCAACGYNKCVDALQFHHLDPTQKDFTMGSVRASIKSWASIVEEARKCIMLCANCHSEVHAGIIKSTEHIKFDESFAEYRKTSFGNQNKCPVCTNLKPSNQKTCSRSCASNFKLPRFNWDAHDLASLIQGRSILSVANQLGISDSAVSKRLRKLGLK
jgi:hypothetical protein